MTTATADVVAAVIGRLRNDEVVTRAVGHVSLFGNTMPCIIGVEMHDDLADLMPRSCIFVNEVAGVRRPRYAGLYTAKVDVRVYHRTMLEVRTLDRLVHGGLQSAPPAVTEGTMVYSITLTGGPTIGREPDTDWPNVLRTYDVLIRE